ncbi:ATP-dependent RNA helicase DDX42, partial [Operophtera brumata]
PQVRSICNHVRPDRQALLFSATFARRVEKLARDALHDPVRVQHGAAGEASDLVAQHSPRRVERLARDALHDPVRVQHGAAGEASDLVAQHSPRRVERLARYALHEPVRVQHGAAGEASDLVAQHVRIFHKPEEKWAWLLKNLVEFLSAGTVLIFVTKKLEAELTAANLGVQQYDALLLHGDMDQADRNKVITAFKRQENNILVATDVAARGLDIPHIRTVVNYTVARDIDTHTHRVGRTGRAGVRGAAYTLLDKHKDKEFAGHLLRNLEGVQQRFKQRHLAEWDDTFPTVASFARYGGLHLTSIDIISFRALLAILIYKERPGLPTHIEEAAPNVPAAVEKILLFLNLSRACYGVETSSKLGASHTSGPSAASNHYNGSTNYMSSDIGHQMGSAASAACETPGGDLRLPTSGFRFTLNQLRTLNSYVDSLWEEDQKGRMSTELESTVESLVQRIMRSRSLEYLVTLDSLPTLNADSTDGEDGRLVDGPDGYGKIRLTGREADKWEEFITPSGYLCRDKVIERWVELIARCANARGGGGSRVLSAQAHTRAQPYSYCYLEKASGSQAGSDRRLAIVEGAAWVMVRIGAGEAEAKLVLAARVHGCAPHHIARIPLTHPLALLHYTSVQGGYYAVAIAPPASVICGERGSKWQLWNPALEAALDAHCSDVSTVGRIAGALNALVDKMREGEDIPPTPSESLEAALLSRWENLNKEAKASAGSTYCRRQLRYLWRESHSTFRANLIQATSPHQESIEDLIHILAIMLDQARDLYVNNFHARSSVEIDRDLSTYR